MDLKPDNILLKGKTLKIADFGTSKHQEEDEESYFGTDWQATFRTAAPEMIKGKNLKTNVDSWGLGCILYEMCTYQHPFL